MASMQLQPHVVKMHVVCSMSNGMNAKGTAEAAPVVCVQLKTSRTHSKSYLGLRSGAAHALVSAHRASGKNIEKILKTPQDA